MFKRYFTTVFSNADRWLDSRRTAPPAVADPTGTIGYEIDREGNVMRDLPFGLDTGRRMKHTAIYAPTGWGKSVALRSLMLSDIRRNLVNDTANIIFLDPNGEDGADRMLALLASLAPPSYWVGRVGLIDADATRISAHSPIYVPKGGDAERVGMDFVGRIMRLVDTTGVRWEELLSNTVLALCKADIDACPLDIQIFLSNAAFRDRILRSANSPILSFYFDSTYNGLSEPERVAWAASVNNKVSRVLGTTFLRRLYRSGAPCDWAKLIDEPHSKAIFIALRKGRVSKRPALLAGSTFIGEILSAVFARASIPEKLRRPTFLVIDESACFAGDERLTNALVETRKYALGLTLATQSPIQIPTQDLRRLFASNLHYTLAGRLGAADAADIVRESGSDDPGDIRRRLMRLAPGEMLAIERGCPPRFVKITKDPDVRVDEGAVDEIREIALDAMGARPVADIDRDIDRRFEALAGLSKPEAGAPNPKSPERYEVRDSAQDQSHGGAKGNGNA